MLVLLQGAVLAMCTLEPGCRRCCCLNAQCMSPTCSIKPLIRTRFGWCLWLSGAYAVAILSPQEVVNVIDCGVKQHYLEVVYLKCIYCSGSVNKP